jgi:hypothetical protein
LVDFSNLRNRPLGVVQVQNPITFRVAGKGGLMLNLPQKRNNRKDEIQTAEDGKHTPKTPTISTLEEKQVTLWDLGDDSRSWLLEASKIISRKWFEQQDEAGKPGSNIGAVLKRSVDEMEGRLVKHTWKLCTVLENETRKVLLEYRVIEK